MSGSTEASCAEVTSAWVNLAPIMARTDATSPPDIPHLQMSPSSQAPFDQLAEDALIRVTNHIHGLFSGEVEFIITENTNKCKACKCKEHCSHFCYGIHTLCIKPACYRVICKHCCKNEVIDSVKLCHFGYTSRYNNNINVVIISCGGMVLVDG